MPQAADNIEGWYAPAFAGVAEQFARNFAERGEIGPSVAIVADSELVVDLHGGSARRRPPVV